MHSEHLEMLARNLAPKTVVSYTDTAQRLAAFTSPIRLASLNPPRSASATGRCNDSSSDSGHAAAPWGRPPSREPVAVSRGMHTDICSHQTVAANEVAWTARGSPRVRIGARGLLPSWPG